LVDDLSHKVVLMRFGYADVIDISNDGSEILRHVIYQYVTVDLFGLPFEAALKEKV
jgi:hypothetical protein